MTMRERKQYKKALERVLKRIQKAKEYYPNKIRKEMEYISDSVITKWYDSYSNRIIYDPYGSLYNACKIEVDDDSYNISFDSSYLYASHHQDNSIVFNNSFIEGYHGGSTGEGLNSSIPHWRTPHPFYRNWGNPAVKTFSPYLEMYDQMDKELKKIQTEMRNEENEIIKEILPYIKGSK